MSGLYTALASRLFFPLHERLKGHHSTALRRELERSQWQSRHEIEAARVERLGKFLESVRQRVPFYRERFERYGFVPEAVREVGSLAALPLLTKADIRANVDRMKADRHGPLKRYNTGGSSGEPLIFFMDRHRISHDVAAKWRATRWWGVDIGDPELVVWGSPIELGTQDRLRQWRDTLLRSHLLPAFEMSRQNLERYIQRIRSERPAMLFGYPSSISLIAAHARKTGRRLDDLGVGVVFVTSERLYDEQRTLIASTFGCPVANGYGARDAGFIAHECPHGSLHISAEHVIVETVDAEGRPTPSGEAGEIVVTHLATPDFPMIRYRTGDVGVLSDDSCPCGRGLPVLREVQGRTTDFVVAADGTVMHGLALIYTVRDLPGVEQFKIVQHSTDRIEVIVVAGPAFGAAERERIVRDFKARLGPEAAVDITAVPDIPREASGKHRYVVSKVVMPHAGGMEHAVARPFAGRRGMQTSDGEIAR